MKNKEFKPTFKDSQEAFEQAISDDRLSGNEQNKLFAGDYMYMGTWNQKDQFKHITNRTYLK